MILNEIDINFWERDFNLPIKYDCYEGESVLKEQEELVSAFLDNKDWIENALPKLVKHCKKDVMADKENKKKDNVFSYIKPHYLYVTREGDNSRIALMCKYRYDPEHGLAIIFDKKGKVEIGNQDLIL